MGYYVYAGGSGKVPYSAGEFPRLEEAIALADEKYADGYFWVEVRQAKKVLYRHERGFLRSLEEATRFSPTPRVRLSSLAESGTLERLAA